MATGVSLSPEGAHVHHIARGDARIGQRPVPATHDQPAVLVHPGRPPLEHGSPSGRSTRTSRLEGRAAAAVVGDEGVRGRRADAERTPAARRSTSPNSAVRSTGPGPGPATWPVGTGSSSSVWSTLIPMPITASGGAVRRVDPLHQDPADLAVADQHVVGPLQRDRGTVPRGRRRTPPASGTSGHHSVSTTGSTARPRRSAPPGRGHPRRGRAGRGPRSGGRRPRRRGAPSGPAAASALVEPAVACRRTCHCGPATSGGRPGRAASRRSGGVHGH